MTIAAPVEGSGMCDDVAGVEKISVVAEDPEEWKKKGNEAYKSKDFTTAIKAYTTALKHCGSAHDELEIACLNNRAACYAQLKDHAKVISDAGQVISRQPANTKALLRRMVALDALGRLPQALEDAASVLTMEPKNSVALEIVAKKRSSLTVKGNAGLQPIKSMRPTEHLSVFLFSRDRPLQCYSCLRSLLRHMKNVVLNVTVFWQAADKACIHSYQLLQNLKEVNRVQWGQVSWCEATKELFPAFSRALARCKAEGHMHVLILSDTAVFHTDVDGSPAVKCMATRGEAHAVRLDVNPRTEWFHEAQLFQGAPKLQKFASDPRILLWKRKYVQRPAYESVPREVGWDAILDWTATIVRVEMVQHFFSALLPPLDTVEDIDTKAADWLSKRQRMKCSELCPKCACYEESCLFTLDPSEFGDVKHADSLLRAHLLSRYDGSDGVAKLATELGWKVEELQGYFKDIDANLISFEALKTLLEPGQYHDVYFDCTRVPASLSAPSLPRSPDPPAPLVSWLIPARNEEGHVHDALASVEAQTGLGAGFFEVVLIDDGSEDKTLSILRKYASSRPYVRIIENGVQTGLGSCLCEGFAACRGDFVARMDADDIAEPDRLVKQLRYMQQHRTISVLGGQTRAFWTEKRKCTIEKISEKEDGRLVASVWRADLGNQNSRRREQITLERKGDEVLMVDGPAEYFGCRVIKVGDELLNLDVEKWREAFRENSFEVLAAAKASQAGEVIMQRRDPPEQPRSSGIFHPLLIRASLLIEDCISGTTVMLRRGDFEAPPFPREEAEGHWCCTSLGPHQHAANIAESLVLKRRHDANRADKAAHDIYESSCAAVVNMLKKEHNCKAADMHDAGALMNIRGPRSDEQGVKVQGLLQKVEDNLRYKYIFPQDADEKGLFWKDFIKGREVGLEQSIKSIRMRFKRIADSNAEAIYKVDEKEERQHRSRTPPR
eukprot:gnl/TRDRNA2_/TRDRNA2_183719_c0_seq1.p1 gnl/TRDRNA2_/TRDRNA2_183719_c0~~gnl/TRDRNA2_/TRDRNA2_183719_c0_seq1.p1  ORF type:complete len:970 (-),score=208.77 gnl/TRDRNA2_/TRDRNA2_183719_c0_seq1:43-2898(-)